MAHYGGMTISASATEAAVPRTTPARLFGAKHKYEGSDMDYEGRGAAHEARERRHEEKLAHIGCAWEITILSLLCCPPRMSG